MVRRLVPFAVWAKAETPTRSKSLQASGWGGSERAPSDAKRFQRVRLFARRLQSFAKSETFGAIIDVYLRHNQRMVDSN
jgi:hypothetical protein